MKKIIFIGVVVLCLGFIQSERSNAVEIPDGAIDGIKLHAQILIKYHDLDRYYNRPVLFGAGTKSPEVQIYLPINDWNKLSADQKKDLKAYAELATTYAKQRPLFYSGISSSAPIAGTIKYNARYIGGDSWAIYAGELTENEKDIVQGKVVARGK